MKQDLHSPTNYHCNYDFSSPNSSVYTYDLNYNNNSNDWLNAGCSKYVRNEATASSPSIHGWSQNSLYLQQATVVEAAAWSYSNHNY